MFVLVVVLLAFVAVVGLAVAAVAVAAAGIVVARPSAAGIVAAGPLRLASAAFAAAEVAAASWLRSAAKPAAGSAAVAAVAHVACIWRSILFPPSLRRFPIGSICHQTPPTYLTFQHTLRHPSTARRYFLPCRMRPTPYPCSQPLCRF